MSVGLGPSTLNRHTVDREMLYKAMPFTSVFGMHQMEKVIKREISHHNLASMGGDTESRGHLSTMGSEIEIDMGVDIDQVRNDIVF